MQVGWIHHLSVSLSGFQSPQAFQVSIVNTDSYWYLFARFRKLRFVAVVDCFSVETADALPTLPVAHAASWSSCDRILREKAQIIRGLGENPALKVASRQCQRCWLCMIGIVPQSDCECLQTDDGLSLAFQSCRDRIQCRDRHTFIKFYQISINASFFSACHSSQLYSFCEVRGATHFGLPSSLGSPGRAKKPGGVLGTVTQDSSSGQCGSFLFSSTRLYFKWP